MKLYRALTLGAQRIAVTLLLLASASLVTAFAIEHARLRMEREAQRRRVCRAELSALTARNLFAEKFLKPSDPCLAIQVVRGGLE